MALLKYKNRAGQWVSLVLDSLSSDSIVQALSAKQGKVLQTNKADKVASPINGDFAGLDSNGNITDSGKKPSDFILASEKGANSGVATLGETGKIPSSQLPSYVDDVVEGYYYNGAFYTDSAHTTLITPETDKLYLDITDGKNHSYRWGGSAYARMDDPQDIIDDNAGDGDTDKTWSADKLVDEIAKKISYDEGGHISGYDLPNYEKSIIDAVSAISGVTHVKVKANFTNSEIDGIPADKICVVVNNGSANSIASAIAESNNSGLETYGTVSRTVGDETIYFSRPTLKALSFGIVLTRLDSSLTLSDVQTSINQAIMALINSTLDVGEKIDSQRIRNTIYGATGEYASKFLISDITIVCNNTTYRDELPVAWYEKCTIINVSYITSTMVDFVDDTAGDGDTDKVWSADKLVDKFNTKADKVTGASENNFAGLDSNGNLKDSGKNANDFIAATEKGANNGVATLDSSGKVRSSQLPSYVDDIVEGYYYEGQFYEEDTHTTVITPETDKIYSDLSSNHTYRWGGTSYVRLDNPEDIIDDTAGEGDTNKVWSADKLAEEFASVDEEIQTLDEEKADNILITDNTEEAVKSFSDGADGQPMKLEVAIDPVQDLHGYDYPWPAGGGKNLFDKTATDTSKGYVEGYHLNVKGTGTANASWNVSEYIPVNPNTVYTISGLPTTGGNLKYLWQYDSEKNRIENTGTHYNNYASQSFTTVATAAYVRASIPVDEVDVLMIELGSTATDYAPYTNICPISGWTGANVFREGKNRTNYYSTTTGKAYDENGNLVDNSKVRLTDFIKVNSSETYTISGEKIRKCTNGGSNVVSIRAIQFDKNKNFISRSEGVLDEDKLTITTGSDTAYLRFSYGLVGMNVQVENGSVVTPVKSYTVKSEEIIFPQSAGTVYGGYIEKYKDGTGKLVVTHSRFDLGSASWTYSGAYLFFRTSDVASKKIVRTGEIPNWTCEVYKIAPVTATSGWATVDNGSISMRTDGQVCIKDTAYTDENALATALSGKYLVYELDNYDEYPLTGEQIKTLFGVNNIWADTGNIIELSYYKHNDSGLVAGIRNRIIRIGDAEGIVDLSDLANEDMIAGEDTVIATESHDEGDVFICNNQLVQATTDIAIGTTIAVGTNVQKITIAEYAKSLANAEATAREGMIEDSSTASDKVWSSQKVSGELAKKSGLILKEIQDQAIASFDDGADDLPLKLLKVGIDPVQDLHGYDYPWVGGAGKNLCYDILDGQAESITRAGVTLTISNKKYCLSGSTIDASTRLHLKSDPFLLKAGTYTLSISADDEVIVAVQDASGTNYYMSADKTKTTETYTFENDTSVRIGINAVYNHDYNTGETFSIQLEAGSTATAWEPYTNICPISGWTGANVNRYVKNLFNKDTVETGTALLPNGSISAVSWCNLSDYIRVEPNTAYYLSHGVGSSALICGAFYDEYRNFISNIPGYGNSDASISISTPENCKYVRINIHTDRLDKAQLERGSSATTYDGSAKTYPVTFPSGAGTVYGGTLTVNKDGSGVLTVDSICKEFDGTEGIAIIEQISSSNVVKFIKSAFNNKAIRNVNSSAIINADHIASNMLKVKRASAWSSAAVSDFSFGAIQNFAWFKINDNTFSDAQSVLTWMAQMKALGTPLQLMYELANPDIFNLTASKVKSLLGLNNVWADTGDIIDLIYYTDNPINYENADAIDLADEANIRSKKAVSNMASSDTVTATANHDSGDVFSVNDVLYKATQSIAIGDTIAVGTNVTPITMKEYIDQQNEADETVISATLDMIADSDAVTATEDHAIGDVFICENHLCRVTSTIVAGDTISEGAGGNVEYITLAEYIGEKLDATMIATDSEVDEMIADYYGGENNA